MSFIQVPFNTTKLVICGFAIVAMCGCQPKGDLASKLRDATTSTIEIVLPSSAASSSSFHSLSAANNGASIPSDLADFDCFAINVVSSDIKGADACGGDASIGLAVGFVSKSKGKISLNVPMGTNRTFQVWGFAGSTKCPDVTELLSLKKGQLPSGVKSPGYLLGQKSVDVLSKQMSIDLSVSFALGTNQKICGSVPAPTTTISYAKLVPGVEAISLSRNGITSNTANVCLGYSTNAVSPVFKCYADGALVTCSQGACNSNGTGANSAAFLFTNSAGTHTFKVETLDNTYGTTDPNPPTFTWTVDTTNPVGTITSILPGTRSSTTGIFHTKSTTPSLTISMNEGGTSSYQIDAGALTSCTSSSLSGYATCITSTVAAGLHTLLMHFTDTAGNSPVDITTSLFVDTTAPTITLTPSDGWLMGGDFSSATSPNALVVAATDNAGGEVNTSTLLCGVEGGTSSACATTLTFTGGGKRAYSITVEDMAGNLTSSSGYAYIDSLTGLPVLGRLTTSADSLSDESTTTLTIGPQPLLTGIKYPGATVLDANSNYLYVADTGNHRVLVFEWNATARTISSPKAVAVFGQPTFYSSDPGTASTATHTPLRDPVGLALGGTTRKLFVADSGNNRIVRFDISTGNANKIADVIFGQANDTTSDLNYNTNLASSNGASDITHGLNKPTGIYYHSSTDRLYVADRLNCRIAAFASASTTATSGNVLSIQLGANGQTLVNGNTWACPPMAADSQNISEVMDVTIDTSANALYAVDSGFNRILVWSTGTGAATATAASAVLGQGAMDKSTAGDALLNPSLTNPSSVAIATDDVGNKYVVVAGSTLNKVKFLDPTSAAVSAVWNSTGSASVGPAQLYTPSRVSYDAVSRNIFVSDLNNHRVGIFSASAPSFDQQMTAVLGHSTFSGNSTSFYAGAPNNPSDGNLNGVTHAVADTTNYRLYVSDTDNHRILVFALDRTTLKPTTKLAMAVIGVSTARGGSYFLDSPATAASAASNTLKQPKGLALDSSQRLYVADSGNNRVLRFPTNGSVLTGISADLVLGQSTFTTRTAGNAMAELSNPTGIAYDSTSDRIFVTDTTNKRVQVFTTLSSITSGTAASSSIGVGGGGTTLDTFEKPEGISYTATVAGVVNRGIFVTDRDNNRVNYFDLTAGIPVNASACYGQHTGVAGDVTNMCATGTANGGGALATDGNYGLNGPQGVFFDSNNSKLYISDTGNNRVVVFDFTNANNKPANANVTTSSVAYHSIGGHTLYSVQSTSTASAASLKSPTGIFRLVPSGGKNLLYISDPAWHRVGVYEVP